MPRPQSAPEQIEAWPKWRDHFDLCRTILFIFVHNRPRAPTDYIDDLSFGDRLSFDQARKLCGDFGMGDLEWGVGHRESNSEVRSVVATDNDAHYFGHDDDDDAVVCAGGETVTDMGIYPHNGQSPKVGRDQRKISAHRSQMMMSWGFWFGLWRRNGSLA